MLKSLVLALIPLTFLACGGGENNTDPGFEDPQCSDGEDNDGDGLIDFPDDPGCISETGTDESAPTSAQCKDGRDNDGDGKIDYPVDPGCTAASDDSERLSNPVACGTTLQIQQIPPTGMVMGQLMPSITASLPSSCVSSAVPAMAYELHLNANKVVEVTTDDGLTEFDSVIDVRRADCLGTDASVACNDNISATNNHSRLSVPLEKGTYYIIVSGKDTTATGTFALQIKLTNGQGTACAAQAECGEGLVCRVFAGATAMTCEKPQCQDGVDDDGDGKIDYPLDPGCASLVDNDEADTCPAGPNCPECGDTIDNDGDGQTDYPNDTTCIAAGGVTEACAETDGVTTITSNPTAGTTVGATHNSAPPTSCSSGAASAMAPDRTYRIDLPALTSLSITTTPGYDNYIYLYNSTCAGTPLQCSDPGTINLTNVAAGSYYLVIDGYFTTSQGTYSINVTGKIPNGNSCESPLAQAGALTCNTGYACGGTVGSRTCRPAACNDGMDNDSDGKIDFPNDPGCDNSGDNDEADPATPPVCSNNMDDDGDTLTDYPADFGCTSAAGTSEVFCVGEVDAPLPVTTNPITGTTAGLANNFASTTCISSSGPDRAFYLQLPVSLSALTVSTVGSTFDTVLTVRDPSCAMQLACDDQGGGSNTSLTNMTNVAAGNYAIVLDGWSGQSGTYTMRVNGTANVGQACTSPLFQGGTNAVLKCPTACVSNVCQ